MNAVNYQLELDKIINKIKAEREKVEDYTPPKLLMHSCCAPCSSYCMEYLREYFDITVFYFNPNISSSDEYQKRVDEEIRLIEAYNNQIVLYREWLNSQKKHEKECDSLIWEQNNMHITPYTRNIVLINGDYDPDLFYYSVKGYESCPEGGARCNKCFELRLKRSFEVAKEIGADYVTSTLTISPLKNATKINEIGKDLENTGVLWLPSDFKKRNGYKRSIELSREFELYRQNFCGCVYSQVERSKSEV